MNTQAERDDHGKGQAIAQARSIAAMVAALNVDYDRLEELQDEKQSLIEDIADVSITDEQMTQDDGKAVGALNTWVAENAEELAELEGAAGESTGESYAFDRIQEDPLDIQVREDWKNPGEESSPCEFNILLCTGGPAVRIMGELDDYMQPSRAWLQCQDWGTPWTDCLGIIDQETLLTYCRQFYFGE